GCDRAHRLVGGEFTGVEVDRVTHRPVVDQGDHEGVTDLPAQGGPGHRAVEQPQLLLDPDGDLAFDLADGEGLPVRGRLLRRGQCRIAGGAVRARLAHDVELVGRRIVAVTLR